MQRTSTALAAFLSGLLVIDCVGATAAEANGPVPAREAAAAVDQLFEASFPRDLTPAPLTGDEDFLRRVSLDLAGTIPTPNEVTLFALDPNREKRSETIDRLLDSDGYSEIWAAYWTEVIFSRATDQRSRINRPVFEEWMRQQLAGNRPWDEVATELVTATGNVQEVGQTALMFAHQGDPAEIASEVSRIFLGIQIQCANCHDHPNDSWTREQFHELAAFFPRVSVRRESQDDPRSFVVASVNDSPRRRDQPEPEQLFRTVDRNRDGRLVKSEAERARFIGDRFDQLLAAGDRDDDGALTLEEYRSLTQRPMNQPGRGTAEYYMPDLNDPSSRGTLVQPAFFVDESRFDAGMPDLERRESLAVAMTSSDNEWFAAAFVNRIWAEMTGVGFYMPIDDLGPLRSAQHRDVLDFLTGQFVSHEHDVKWLYRTIANTETYQREIRTLEPGSEAEAFASASPTRLRSDQVYNALTQVLGVEQSGGRFRGRGDGANRGNAGRAAFSELFGYDPSTPQEDIVGSIPQALYLMNSPQLNSQIRGTGDTRLGRILRDNDDDRDALAELYLRVLAREPSDRELEINAGHIAEVGNRVEAFEDIMWSLLNSSEFLSKR